MHLVWNCGKLADADQDVVRLYVVQPQQQHYNSASTECFNSHLSITVCHRWQCKPLIRVFTLIIYNNTPNSKKNWFRGFWIYAPYRFWHTKKPLTIVISSWGVNSLFECVCCVISAIKRVFLLLRAPSWRRPHILGLYTDVQQDDLARCHKSWCHRLATWFFMNYYYLNVSKQHPPFERFSTYRKNWPIGVKISA